MSEEVISTHFGLVEEVVGRLEEALSGGEVFVRANTRSQRVALGLRLSLLSRIFAIGTIADKPAARAAMYDCLRSMCESAAHLNWLVDVHGEVDDRSGCIELAQAMAEVNNLKKLLAVHGASWISDEIRKQQTDRFESAKKMLTAARSAHLSPCKHCRGNGRDEGNVPNWLKSRATGKRATSNDLDLYVLWVACSADVHQLVPQRFSQANGNYLELSAAEAGRVLNWAIGLLLACAPLIASIVRPESLPNVQAVATWWDRLMIDAHPSTSGKSGEAVSRP